MHGRCCTITWPTEPLVRYCGCRVRRLHPVCDKHVSFIRRVHQAGACSRIRWVALGWGENHSLCKINTTIARQHPLQAPRQSAQPPPAANGLPSPQPPALCSASGARALARRARVLHLGPAGRATAVRLVMQAVEAPEADLVPAGCTVHNTCSGAKTVRATWRGMHTQHTQRPRMAGWAGVGQPCGGGAPQGLKA